MNVLPFLYNLPEMSIYSFINDADKKIYIGFAYDTLSAISRLVREIKYRNNSFGQDSDKLEFRIIETIETRKDIRLKYQYWVDYYSNIGYTHYRNYKAVQYNLHIEPVADFRPGNSRSCLYSVKAVSRGRRERLIGIFDKVGELNQFMETNYPVRKNIKSIVYSNNRLSQEYRKLYG